jgi:hypothetical protein
MLTKALALFLLMGFSTQVLSKVEIQVALSPAGSFEIESPRVRGQARADGQGGFVADQLRVAVNTLKSGIELRDEHMHDKLKSTQHPQIVVTNANGKAGKGKAEIEIAGVKRPIEFVYRELGRELEVEFILNLRAFQISGISYMGVGVRDEVKVKARVPVR